MRSPLGCLLTVGFELLALSVTSQRTGTTSARVIDARLERDGSFRQES